MKQLLILLIPGVLLTSCFTQTSIMNTNANMRNVELGMTQKEVIAIMGDRYEILSNNSQGVTWGYKSYDNAIYKLYFENGILIEWNKEWLKKIPETVVVKP